MFKFEDVITVEEKTVMRGIASGYTKKNFSTSGLGQAKRDSRVIECQKEVVGKNFPVDTEGVYFKEVRAKIYAEEKRRSAAVAKTLR